MKKAYIILAHKNPAQVNHLVNRLNDQHSHFFIHLDLIADLNSFQNHLKSNNVIFTQRVRSAWAKIGVVEATIKALEAIKETNIVFDRIILLSGQDYPIKSNEYIDAFLKHSEFSNFIKHKLVKDNKETPEYNMWRINSFYFGENKWQRYASRLLQKGGKIFPFLRRKFNGKLKYYIGSQWWIIDMRALDYILNYLKANSDYVRSFKHVFAPDEIFFNTILLNAQDEDLIKSIHNDNKMFIKHNKGAAHPTILVEANLNEILNSDALFARKFDFSKDNKIIELLDEQVLKNSENKHFNFNSDNEI